jgi:hypothetical protein
MLAREVLLTTRDAMLYASHNFSMAVPSTASTSVRTSAADESAPAVARRLRVLFVNDTARNGGPGRSLQLGQQLVAHPTRDSRAPRRAGLTRGCR